MKAACGSAAGISNGGRCADPFRQNRLSDSGAADTSAGPVPFDRERLGRYVSVLRRFREEL